MNFVKLLAIWFLLGAFTAVSIGFLVPKLGCLGAAGFFAAFMIGSLAAQAKDIAADMARVKTDRFGKPSTHSQGRILSVLTAVFKEERYSAPFIFRAVEWAGLALAGALFTRAFTG